MSRIRDCFAVLDCQQVNHRIQEDAAAFVREEEQRYTENIEQVAAALAKQIHGGCPVLQCGPSSVGKTTTAARLSEALAAKGVQATVVSLDDFYRGTGLAPRMPDGRFDYESPEALDLERLRSCVRALVENGQAVFPIYDFEVGRPSEETRTVTVSGDTAVFFEGVHAFTPTLAQVFASAGTAPLRVFVNTGSRFSCGGETLLLRRDIRLCRRLLRDERTRASSFYHTMTMWEQVLYGFETYILPYADEAHYTVDTTLGYEPSVLRGPMLARLHTLDGTPYEKEGRRLRAAFELFAPLPFSAVPHTSVLTEFLAKHDSSCVLG